MMEGRGPHQHDRIKRERERDPPPAAARPRARHPNEYTPTSPGAARPPCRVVRREPLTLSLGTGRTGPHLPHRIVRAPARRFATFAPPPAGILILVAASLSCSKGAPSRVAETLSIAVPYDLNSLDPHAKDKLGSFAILSNVYEPLVSVEKDLKVQPCLARSWENPDLSTWIFHLRPHVTFHSGRRLGSADVVYSFNRVLRSDDLEMKTYLLDIEEVSAVGPLEVRIRSRSSSRNFLNKLASLLIIPEGETGATLRSSDGTGPYSLISNEENRVIRLRRNANYWAGAPAFGEVTFFLALPAEEAIGGLLAGSYQLIQCDSRKVEAALRESGRKEIKRHPNLYVKYLGYDLAREVTPFCGARPNPFRKKAVRQAIHAALDRRALVAALAGYAAPATQPIPRFVFGFNPQIQEPASDPVRARTLLKQAGLPGGFPVVLHVRQVLGEAAFLVREQLGRIGIAVEVSTLPDAAFYDLVDRRGASFFLNRFGCPTGDASDLLDDVVHSLDRERHLGTRNFGGYSDPDLDRAIEASAGIERVDERRKALQDILSRVMDELVLIPLYNDEDVYAMDRTLAFEPQSDSVIRAAAIGLRP